MMTNIKRLGVYTVLTVTLMGFMVPNVQAQTVTNQDIAGQERVVVLKIIETLEEQLKLVQMIYIQRLERRVTELEMMLANK